MPANNNKILMVVAYPDNRALGCGGMIAKHAKTNEIYEEAILALVRRRGSTVGVKYTEAFELIRIIKVI